MKIQLAIILTIVVLLTFTGCMESKNTTLIETTSPVEITSPVETTITQQTLPIETKKMLQEALLSNLVTQYNDMEKINYYYPKGSPFTVNSFAFYSYMGQKDDNVGLRFVTGFHRDDSNII